GFVDRLPEHLHVAKEEHPVRTPVLEDVRKDVDIHEGAVRLSGAEFSPLTVDVARTNGELPLIRPHTEQVVLEYHLERRALWRGNGRPHPESRLPSTDPGVAVGAELVLERRKPRR